MWRPRGYGGEETDEESQGPAQAPRHQAGPHCEAEPVGTDYRPSVDSEVHLYQKQSQETPVEEEGIKLAQYWVLLVVTRKYKVYQLSIMWNVIKLSL